MFVADGTGISTTIQAAQQTLKIYDDFEDSELSSDEEFRAGPITAIDSPFGYRCIVAS
jgi:hypothetical protein